MKECNKKYGTTLSSLCKSEMPTPFKQPLVENQRTMKINSAG